MPEGLISSLLLNGTNAGQHLTHEQAGNWQPQDGLLWLHFDYKHKKTRNWLKNICKLPPLETEALLVQDTRPRIVRAGNGLLLALRGINLNPGADPEDMVSIRLYIDQQRIISTCSRQLLAVKELQQAISDGSGPQSSGDFLLSLCDKLTDRKIDFIDQLEDKLADMEELLVSGEGRELRVDVAELRRQTVVLRRYLAPQREAYIKLLNDSASLFDDSQKRRFGEISDTLIRGIEDLDSIRERATVAQEELQNRQTEALNQRLYFLALISAIFLPLGFLTGLLGVNIAGIPGADSHWAFAAFCGFLLLLVGFQLWLFYRFRWL
ncbi:MAG: zinc transporter [Shewanella sp.]|jgi:zinc transporter|uniref:zinc transporter ZntB n=1 Tax=Shewanella TaxID=22 RepID=UPI0016786D58|nr:MULTISPECIES: zinc transporter ZntB [Shewanella]MBO1271862.1 zinc transporter ZntB [Shewanella sp. 4t3-1-2LB]MCL2906045.1 zinc transporter ZntB [Shewanella fodinae]MDN5369710.1 zinc transporter [Shewanella sp.]GGY96068.1 zinc transporter ZntB [Shewanella fodinae]